MIRTEGAAKRFQGFQKIPGLNIIGANKADAVFGADFQPRNFLKTPEFFDLRLRRGFSTPEFLKTPEYKTPEFFQNPRKPRNKFRGSGVNPGRKSPWN